MIRASEVRDAPLTGTDRHHLVAGDPVPCPVAADTEKHVTTGESYGQ